MRRWLVIPSIVFHTGLVVALLFLGAWHLDRLEPGRRDVTIGYVPPPPPASEGSPAPKAAKPFEHKKHITHDIETPPEPPAKPPTADVPDTPDGQSGNGLGSGSGEGSGTTPGITDGPCTVDCGKTVVEKKKIEQNKVDLLPTVLMGLRISGDTQMQPSGATKSDMQFHQLDKLRSTFQVCLDASGNVSSARQLHTTGYAEYDASLKAGIATWRYRPYMVGGQGIPACGIVSFVYTMR